MKIIIRKLPSALTILKKVNAELLGPPPKFQVNVKIQLIMAVFPDYLSVSYDYLYIQINKLLQTTFENYIYIVYVWKLQVYLKAYFVH